MSRQDLTDARLRRWPPTAVVLAALIASFLAGCAGDEDLVPESAPVEVEPGLWVAAGHGVLRGVVLNDAGLPLSGARVSILGTDFFGDSGPSGRFQFVNVSAGDHQVQVVASGFQPHLHPVTLGAANVTEIEVQMVPDLSAGGGYRPHLHDYWGGADTFDLLDASVSLDDAPEGAIPEEYYIVANGVLRPNNNATMWTVPLIETPSGKPPIVFPGTVRITVRAAWSDPQTQIEALGWCWNGAAEDDEGCTGPGPSGTDFEFQVAPTSTDSGHQRFSLWEFALYHPAVEDGGQPSLAFGEVQVLITLHRGDVALEPAHARYWDDGPSRVVFDDSVAGTSVCCSGFPLIRFDEIVAPGTTRIRIEHEWQMNEGFAAAGWDYPMIVRPGSMNPHTTDRWDWLEPAPMEGGPGDQVKVYEFEVAREDTDAFYQTQTNWRLSFYNALLGSDQYYDPHPQPVTHVVKVTIFNDDLANDPGA